MSFLRRFLNTACLAAMAHRQRALPWWPLERIQRIQRRRLQSILRHAYHTVPFYRRVMRERRLRPEDFKTAEDLAQLPLIDGVSVWRDPQQFISERYARRPHLAYLSSGGVSHVQKRLYWDHWACLRQLAYCERDRAVLNALVGQEWGQVQLYILPSSSVSRELREFWNSQVLIRARLAHRHFLSTETPFEDVVGQLNVVRPAVVFSYGVYADEFFRFLDSRRPQVALPKVWMYGGDMLSEGGEELMEKTFGCTVYSTYQAVESGRIGFQCERRKGFHLNMDLCPIRLIDETCRTVRPGQCGEVVVSNLINRAMVLLNYRLGDLGILAAEPCPCGRSLPWLEKLIGRVNEVIHLPNGRRLIGLDVDFKEELKAAFQAQLVQTGPGEILWRVVPLPNTDREALRRRVLAKAQTVLGHDIHVTVEFVDKIPHTLAGKFVRAIPLPPPGGRP